METLGTHLNHRQWQYRTMTAWITVLEGRDKSPSSGLLSQGSFLSGFSPGWPYFLRSLMGLN